jgi:UDP-N-acetyl-D-glucosamine/UDP-N-acetyl-D-galactosamine dehydrogenase
VKSKIGVEYMKEGISLKKNINITVIGLGYVGLPTAISFYKNGNKVFGVDISKKTIEKIKNGVNPLIDSEIDLEIPQSSDNWLVTDDYKDVIPLSDIIIITVPTPVDYQKKPDLSYIKSACEMVIKSMDKDKEIILILESTVYPGVTRDLVGGIFKKNDVYDKVTLAYCPERVSPGDSGKSTNSVARVLGCDDSSIGNELAELYSQITSKGCKYVGKLEVAEAAKLIENVQRDIDIAFVNELAILMPKIGLDVIDVLDAAGTKWNFHSHKPGIGVGGHCIPVDPYYYIDIVKNKNMPSSISKRAREINEIMPFHAVNEILRILEKSEPKKILILGYSYKGNVGDTRETPVKIIIDELQKSNVSILLWDPLVPNSEMHENVKIIKDPYEEDKIDLIVVCTDHKEILELDYKRLINNSNSKIIYDGRRCLDKMTIEKIGWQYTGIGTTNII